ncbi:MAG: cell division protein FtsX [Sulfitobacter sp.]
MKVVQASLRSLLSADRQADRVVPPSGFTAQLTLFAAGAMAFLAVFALALSLASGRLARSWGQELAQSATVRIIAPMDQRGAQTDAALAVLETTRGVASARALSDEEQSALLAPWFGNAVQLEGLPVPRLIEIVENGEGLDTDGLRLRLSAEVPGATLDDHSRWREPLVAAAARLRWLGWLSALLIGGVTAAMVTLAANAALSANAQVIAVLRQVGATDAYIAQAFIRRFTLRALIGAAVGTAAGLIAVLLMSFGQSQDAGFLTGIGFKGWHWLVPILLPPLAGVVAFLATRAASTRTLERLS